MQLHVALLRFRGASDKLLQLQRSNQTRDTAKMLVDRLTNRYRQLSRFLALIFHPTGVPLHDDGAYFAPVPYGQYACEPFLNVENAQERLCGSPIRFAGEAPYYGSEFPAVELHDGKPGVASVHPEDDSL